LPGGRPQLAQCRAEREHRQVADDRDHQEVRQGGEGAVRGRGGEGEQRGGRHEPGAAEDAQPGQAQGHRPAEPPGPAGAGGGQEHREVEEVGAGGAQQAVPPAGHQLGPPGGRGDAWPGRRAGPAEQHDGAGRRTRGQADEHGLSRLGERQDRGRREHDERLDRHARAFPADRAEGGEPGREQEGGARDDPVARHGRDGREEREQVAQRGQAQDPAAEDPPGDQPFTVGLLPGQHGRVEPHELPRQHRPPGHRRDDGHHGERCRRLVGDADRAAQRVESEEREDGETSAQHQSESALVPAEPPQGEDLHRAAHRQIRII
jgi:hypothetical protein